MRYGFVFNIERCNGCYSCFLACKDEHTGNCHKPICAPTCEGVNLMKLNEIEYGTGSKVKVDYVNTICQQCANPACMKKYPDQVYKRPDGIVIIDPEKAKGNRDMVNACPYGAIFWNEKEQLPYLLRTSIGFSRWQQGQSLEELTEQADGELYREKKKKKVGRTRKTGSH